MDCDTRLMLRNELFSHFVLSLLFMSLILYFFNSAVHEEIILCGCYIVLFGEEVVK